MRVVLEIVEGPSAGRRLELQTGQSGQVGRASWAALSAPNDLTLAGMHFAVECGPDCCVLRALNREKPTYVNDAKVSEIVLRDGDVVVAGSNTFSVRVEGGGAELRSAEPKRTARRPTLATMPTAQPAQDVRPQNLVEFLRQTQPLFAILDAARKDRILTLLKEHRDEHQSLYEGPEAEQLAEVAPYLVRLKPQSKLLDALVAEGWGDSWGVYLKCSEEFAMVRKQLRRFLMVENEGRECYFAFYDPRVLRAFLPACSGEEAAQFFGPIEQFLVEAAESSLLLRFSAGRRGVKQDMVLVGSST
jgi:hypothetical protein